MFVQTYYQQFVAEESKIIQIERLIYEDIYTNLGKRIYEKKKRILDYNKQMMWLS